MRVFLFFVVALFFSFSASGGPVVKLTNIELKKAFTPNGFDTNDQSQVAVASVFPNTCYRVGPYEVDVNEAKQRVTVTLKTYQVSGPCLRMFVPFFKVLDIGLLRNEGTYDIYDGTSGRQLSSLRVQEAKDNKYGTDNEYYAPLTDAYIAKNSKGENEVVLRGRFSSECMQFKNIKVNYFKDVIEVLPIVENTKPKDPNSCKEGKFSFTKKKTLKPLKEDAYLVHIRAMQGDAINRIYQPE